MTLVSRALAFAMQAHDGMMRKGTKIPYILHPTEAAAIVSSVTEDEELLAAALLHDVIEDCGVTEQEICERFGARVARIVLAESETKEGDPFETWDKRKQEAINKLKRAGFDEKVVILGDKLSNMRAIRRDYDRDGEVLFLRFHQHDKRRHAWYYRSCVSLIRDELGHTPAWRELNGLVEYVFSDIPAEA